MNVDEPVLDVGVRTHADVEGPSTLELGDWGDTGAWEDCSSICLSLASRAAIRSFVADGFPCPFNKDNVVGLDVSVGRFVGREASG